MEWIQCCLSVLIAASTFNKFPAFSFVPSFTFQPSSYLPTPLVTSYLFFFFAFLETQRKRMPTQELQFPPGFRFHPTDDELVMHYLYPKYASQPIAVSIIGEIDLYKYDPWDLPGMALYGEKEWYFFSPRNRKYPNGSRPNRAAGCGYWKATGPDKIIGNPKPVGIKKALVFYSGKAPKGEKTNWIMHEYRLADVDRSRRNPNDDDNNNNNSSRLDDLVLCRIYKKKSSSENQHDSRPIVSQHVPRNDENTSEIRTEVIKNSPATYSDFVYVDTSDSVPRMLADCSTSEHVVSPQLTCEREVQSEQKLNEWDKAALDFPFNYEDATMDLAPQFQSSYQMSPLQDMFMHLW